MTQQNEICAIEVSRVSQVVRRDLAIISAAGSQPESHYIVVSVHTKTGHTGYGEATVVPAWSGESQDSAASIVNQLLAPLLIGEDPTHVAALADKMDRYLIGNPFTKCALEMALLDVSGKILGVPVVTLLGGPRRAPEIGLKFSIGAFSPQEAARVALHAKSIGLKAVKVKVGLDVAGDIARVTAVREALGDDFRIAVDGNGGWLENDALLALPHLEALKVNCIEQPLRRGDFRNCARLRERTHIPLMLDESVFTRQDAMEAIRQEACDIISVYPGKNGGITRSLEIAQMAAVAGLRCTIGSNLEMDLGSAAMLHVAAALPSLASAVDHDIIGPLYYDEHFTSSPIQFRNGCAVLPDGPGLGVDFKP
ncbi:mandelate racemase/muconate lactonizing enzyme family protein [Bryobacter aggregatus]|uniref:mandelate racemase/muconate lactonizing enzyme family protein n=1 Tax=Bryobacter aggregatus TaxID=360054 RepID=UPI0004E11306|nr:enolase C-terminal domain-like protein [Bryobacter aggregatus]